MQNIWAPVEKYFMQRVVKVRTSDGVENLMAKNTIVKCWAFLLFNHSNKDSISFVLYIVYEPRNHYRYALLMGKRSNDKIILMINGIDLASPLASLFKYSPPNIF